jgi:hypothetical protein
MYDKYSKVLPLTSNQFVSGSKALMIDNINTTPPGGTTLDLYAYTSTGVTSNVRIHVPISSFQILPIKVAGVSFAAASLSIWSLS